MSERFDLGVWVSPVLLALRQTWTTPLVWFTWSRELAQLARAQAECDRQDEEGFEAEVAVVGLVNAELGAAGTADGLLDLSVYLRDRRVGVWLGAAR